MFIDHIEKLKEWLTTSLTPICEADPGALAKYVVALVKKEKPIAELRESCVDQLDVFLQTKTKPFVDTLFEVLDKKSYFTEEDLKPAPARVEPDSQTILPSEAGTGGEPVPAETLIIPERKPSTEIAVTVAENKDDPPIITSNVPSNEPRRRRSRSRSPRLYRGRDGDERRRRYDDRERRPYDRGPPRRKSNSPIPIKQRLGPRPRSRSPNRRRSPYRPLNRSRSPRARPRGRPFSRSRSKTRSPRRSWSRSRSRERLRSRSPYSGKSRSPRRQVIRPRSPRPGSPGRMSRSPRPRSKSPIYRSRSPGRRSRSPVRRISRSPGRMSRSPIRRLSRSPARRVSPVRGSPIRRSSKSPLRTSRSRSPIRRSRSPGRRLSRSPIRRSGSPIRRSGSPGRRLSRSPLRRSLSPDSRSRSPTRFSRSRSGTRSRSDSPRRKVLRRDSDSRGPTPTQEDGLGGSPTPTLSSIAVVTGSYREGEPRSEPRPDSRLRCRDFDEKGFCVRGDLCVYDHGADPVIVENLPQYPSPGPPGPRLPQVSGPPPGFPVGLPPPGFMGRMPGPPPHLLRPPRPEFQEYNPEAPGINIRPRGPPPGFWPGAPRGLPPLGFLCGPPPQAPTAQLPRTRDLVNLTTVKREPEVEPEPDDDEEVPTSSSRTVIIPKEELPAPVPQPPPPGTLSEVTTAPAAPAAPTYTQPQHQFLHQQRYHPYQRFPGPRKPFDYGRVGGYRRPDMTNCTLEVNKIPRDMNNIAKLNEHFGTFGTLKNIEVSYEGDPEAALITYRTNFEALKCYKSSEPVFNNRFIKLFWHKKADTNGSQEQAPSSTTTPGVPNPSQPDPDSSRQPAEARLGPAPPTIPPASKLSLNNVTKSTPSIHPTSADKGVVYTTSMGTISKTVYNPVAQKPKTQIADNMISPTAVMAAGFISRIEAVKKHEAVKQEAIQKSLEIRKNKQQLLEKQIGQQKLLIARLEKNKTMKEEEKSVIMTALKSLTENIEKLKSELGGRKVVLKKQKSVEVKSPEQAKKEILDVELELMTKSTSGEDTADLKLKLSELTKVANSMGLLGRGRGRGAVVQGTATTWVASGVARPTLVVGRGRGRGALTGRAAVASRTLDRRPRTVEVTGFTAEEKEEIALHLAKMREVEKMEFNMSVPSAILTFKTRHDGEMGILYGSKFKTKTLKMTWHVPKPTFTRSSSSLSGDTEDADTESNVDEIDEEALLAGEDEDEEGEGERSWKH